MKKYILTVMTYTQSFDTTILATKFSTTTNNSISSGFYSFYDKDKLVGCYPIDKTIIKSIEEIEI